MASSVIKMTVAEWIKVKDNPVQRDTQRHAQRAAHLLTPLPVHSIVWAARMPGGSLIKLDGHTRALLWSQAIVPHPPVIEVHVMDVKNTEEAISLYKTFDSKDALETTADKVFGALKGLKLSPESPFVISGAFNSALRVVREATFGYSKSKRSYDIYSTISEFIPEIAALDRLGMKKGQVTLGIVAAMMISYRKHGEKVMGFWKSVLLNEGKKSNRQMDAIEAVNSMMNATRGRHGAVAQLDLCGRALNALERYLDGEMFVSMPRPINVNTYLGSKTEAATKLIRSKTKAA